MQKACDERLGTEDDGGPSDGEDEEAEMRTCFTFCQPADRPAGEHSTQTTAGGGSELLIVAKSRTSSSTNMYC